ncbi:MAG TPA: hypothetical protein PLE54_18415 [Burkholderiaceae bacterium]|nr:hypothetical protein [Burkholderiaceae bacterium]HQR72585.1 hypothetical protein [Burkholderiaceae bacterium]
MFARIFLFIFAAASAFLMTGCATRATTVDAQWVNPAIAGKGAVRNVLVIAALRDSTQRRLLEDRMVEALAATGVKAAPSYRFIPDTGQVTEGQLRSAVASAGASHVLASSISSVTTDVRVTQGMVMGPGWGPGRGWSTSMGPGWNGMTTYYSGAWTRSITADVQTTHNLHGDTRLFDASISEVVWSAATTTVTGWDTVPRMIDQFVRVIVDTLKKDAVI